jgi:sporulation protein YlmC with PRC-barrel domain
MMINRLATAAIGLALFSVPVVAQTSAPPASTSTTTTSTTTTTQFMTTMKAGEWRASKLKGVYVYNSANEKIGDINELLIDSSGKIEAAVVGVGGFLGMGEHDVAVPFSQLKPVMQAVQTSSTAPNAPAGTQRNAANTSNDVTGTVRDASDRGYPDHFLLDMTKDQLKAAPQFSYSAAK